jgi:hypothetical protein
MLQKAGEMILFGWLCERSREALARTPSSGMAVRSLSEPVAASKKSRKAARGCPSGARIDATYTCSVTVWCAAISSCHIQSEQSGVQYSFRRDPSSLNFATTFFSDLIPSSARLVNASHRRRDCRASKPLLPLASSSNRSISYSSAVSRACRMRIFLVASLMNVRRSLLNVRKSQSFAVAISRDLTCKQRIAITYFS